MDCNRFEEGLSDYFDSLLAPQEVSLFRAHALQCRGCRSLMDDVKAAINVCKQHDELEPPALLEAMLAAIPVEHGALGCSGFEDLITEFLDGFVPAETYHRFEEHAEKCDQCSTLLTGVVYAVAACHSVHTFEEVEVAEPVIARLIAMMPQQKPPLARRVADRFAAFAGHLIPRATQSARWTFATAGSLAFATFALLLFGFSDDGTVGGIYRQARVKVSELYTQGAEVYTQTDKAVARLERVGLGIGEFWDTLGGETKSDGKDNHDQKQEPNSNRRLQTNEKN
ncbi:MAG: zf-HC2 domain-containing protein [Acidobacteriota bacterium]